MSSHAIGIAGYLVLLLAAAALVVLSHRPGRKVATAGQLVASARRSWAGRVALVLVWWWVGWHLFVR